MNLKKKIVSLALSMLMAAVAIGVANAASLSDYHRDAIPVTQQPSKLGMNLQSPEAKPAHGAAIAEIQTNMADKPKITVVPNSGTAKTQTPAPQNVPNPNHQTHYHVNHNASMNSQPMYHNTQNCSR